MDGNIALGLILIFLDLGSEYFALLCTNDRMVFMGGFCRSQVRLPACVSLCIKGVWVDASWGTESRSGDNV